MKRTSAGLAKSAVSLLAQLAGHRSPHETARRPIQDARKSAHDADIAALIAADLVVRSPNGEIEITSTGRAHVARNVSARANGPIDPFRAQHLALAQRALDPGYGTATIDESESPLAWLARRKGRDGCTHIEPVQLQAGERLRTEFTRAQLMPHTTSNWGSTVSDSHRGAGQPATYTEAVIAARQRVRHALDAVGPEFSGHLLDVCCFLKGLADVERERGWPPRSAKVVLQLGLERLARHYGLASEARGLAHAPVRIWLAPDARFVVSE